MTAAVQEFSGTGVQATADIEKGLVKVVADIAAKPEAVFKALTDPAELAQWWGAEGIYRTERWSVDLRQGGKWVSYIMMKPGDTDERTRRAAAGSTRRVHHCRSAASARVHMVAELGWIRHDESSVRDRADCFRIETHPDS